MHRKSPIRSVRDGRSSRQSPLIRRLEVVVELLDSAKIQRKRRPWSVFKEHYQGLRMAGFQKV